jgi:pimeloyl-ACP methyl ester carboxylesterase
VLSKRLLTRGYRAIVWDMRSHGESAMAADARFTAADSLDDLAALLDECQLDQPVLVGHSLRGAISLKLSSAPTPTASPGTSSWPQRGTPGR